MARGAVARALGASFASDELAAFAQNRLKPARIEELHGGVATKRFANQYSASSCILHVVWGSHIFGAECPSFARRLK